MALVVKNPPVNAGDARDMDSIPGSGRSPGEGNRNPLQYSCLENPMDRGAWWATVHGVTKGQTGLKQISRHACTSVYPNYTRMGLILTETFSAFTTPILLSIFS